LKEIRYRPIEFVSFAVPHDKRADPGFCVPLDTDAMSVRCGERFNATATCDGFSSFDDTNAADGGGKSGVLLAGAMLQ